MNSGTRRIKTVTLFLIVFLYVISVSLGQETEKNNNPEDEEEKVPNFQRKVSGLIQKLMNSKYVRTPKLQRRLARIDDALNDNLNNSKIKSETVVEKFNFTKLNNTQPATLLKIITNSTIDDANTTSDVFG